MNKNFIFQLISFFVFLFVSGGSLMANDILLKEASNDNLEFYLSSEKEVYALNEDMYFSGKLTNKGLRPIVINKIFMINRAEGGVILEFVLPDGEKWSPVVFYETKAFDKNDFIELKPGESYSNNIKMYSRPDKKGTYTVTGWYYNEVGKLLGIDAWTGKIESNQIQIIID